MNTLIKISPIENSKESATAVFKGLLKLTKLKLKSTVIRGEKGGHGGFTWVGEKA